MAVDIVLYKGSKKCLTYAATEVPTGMSIAGAHLMIKNAWSDADSAALLEKLISTNENADQGVISDSGDGDGVAELRFYITDLDLDDIEPGTYFVAVKAILGDSSPYVFPDAFQTVQIYAAGIEATT